jgi:hypothetical protein
MTHPRTITVLALTAGLCGACNNERGFSFRDVDSVAVTIGDFDNVQEPFNRMVVDTTRYDGIISTATWVEDEEDFQAPTLDVETLFLSERNQELRSHGVVFVASGTRGFGEREYNSLQPDDGIVSSEIAQENAEGFVRQGGVLWLTDWSYDLIPRTFPDQIDFLGDESQLDAAQRGDIGRITARVVDEDLAAALETDQLSLEYNFSNWAVIESVADDSDVRVWLRGDVTYRDGSGEGTRNLTDVPLLVSVRTGGEGRGELVYSTFHLDAQNGAVIDTMLQTIVGDFDLESTASTPGAQ